jgi:hypothetical protein
VCQPQRRIAALEAELAAERTAKCKAECERDEARAEALAKDPAIYGRKELTLKLQERVAELEATLREIKDAAKCDDYDALIVQLRGVAELEADRERLEEMERLHDAGPWPDTDAFDDGQTVKVWIVTSSGEHKTYGTLREAIDAAREAAKG